MLRRQSSSPRRPFAASAQRVFSDEQQALRYAHRAALRRRAAVRGRGADPPNPRAVDVRLIEISDTIAINGVGGQRSGAARPGRRRRLPIPATVLPRWPTCAVGSLRAVRRRRAPRRRARRARRPKCRSNARLHPNARIRPDPTRTGHRDAIVARMETGCACSATSSSNEGEGGNGTGRVGPWIGCESTVKPPIRWLRCSGQWSSDHTRSSTATWLPSAVGCGETGRAGRRKRDRSRARDFG